MPAVYPRQLPAQSPVPALHPPAKRRLRFYLPLFQSAHESDSPVAPSRSSLPDKAVRLTSLAPWPPPHSNPLDPSLVGRLRIARPHRVLPKWASPRSQVLLLRQCRLC